MAIAGFIVVMVVIVGLRVWYGNWLRSRIQPKSVTTTLSRDELRSLFRSNVATTGWQIVDDGEPIMAQSPLATGIRQQIVLHVKELGGGQRSATIAVARMATKYGSPSKSHTLHHRMTKFLAAVANHRAQP